MIRNFTKEDAQEVSDLVALTLRTTNIKDYSAERIEADILIFNAQYLINRMSWTNGYVYCDGEKIVGSGFIGNFWDKKDEACLFTFFVHPDYQGKGIGRQLINAVENDEYFLRSKRIEIPASITAVEFYRKFGYDYKNGVTEPDDEQLVRLEKFRNESVIYGVK